MCELCLLALGEPIEHSFKKPGPTHHARWMQKIIYVLKMYLFRKQLDLSVAIKRKLQQLSLFFTLIYTKTWLTAPIVADAPVNDLKLYEDLISFKAIHSKIAKAALDKFTGHLWYLSPEIVPLALFSSLLSSEDKQDLQKAIITAQDENSSEPRQRKFIGELKAAKLTDLVGPDSMKTFIDLGFDSEFLATSNPAYWQTNGEYAAMKEKVASLKGINDTAERAIAMMTRYNGKLTKNEKTLQQNLQVNFVLKFSKKNLN